MLEELKIEEQDWRNPFKGINLTPYRIIAATDAGSKDMNISENVKLGDGAPINCSDLKKQLGYCQLIDWNADGKNLIKWVQYKKEHPESPCDIVVDSGAFSMWSCGKPFDIDKYINFLNSNDIIETAFWVAEADVIPGKKNVDPTEEERAAAPEKSWENYIYMTKRVKCPKKIVPIFHMGEDYKHLLRMLSYRFADGDFIPYIGISPRNDVHVNEKIKWYEETWKIIEDECAKLGRDLPLTHNFGCTTISIMEQFPSCSSDSSSWMQSATKGRIMIPINGKMKTIYVSDRNTLSSEHIYNQSAGVRDAVEKLCAKIGHGITLKNLCEDDPKGDLKMLFNLYSLNEWKKNFKYEGNSFYREDLW